MRKKVCSIFTIAAITAIATFNFEKNNNDATLSDLALANVEALARGEGADENCYSSYPDWCDFVVSTPNGNHIESHPYMNERL